MAAMAGVLGVLAGGCAALADDGEPIDDEPGATTEIAEPAVGLQEDHTPTSDLDPEDTCCQYGLYTCPATGRTFEYNPPGCGVLTRLQAYHACNNACGPQCTDTGWQDPC